MTENCTRNGDEPGDAAPDADAGFNVDPEDFLRALLKISPQDAAKVREDAAKRGGIPEDEGTPRGQYGPH